MLEVKQLTDSLGIEKISITSSFEFNVYLKDNSFITVSNNRRINRTYNDQKSENEILRQKKNYHFA
jgi:hypothetical protein